MSVRQVDSCQYHIAKDVSRCRVNYLRVLPFFAEVALSPGPPLFMGKNNWWGRTAFRIAFAQSRLAFVGCTRVLSRDSPRPHQKRWLAMIENWCAGMESNHRLPVTCRSKSVEHSSVELPAHRMFVAGILIPEIWGLYTLFQDSTDRSSSRILSSRLSLSISNWWISL